ncbi:MAG: hypothetical protein LAT68_06325 [Cyclobacteriaceae bacterium]|nr:hypothetical protein [Cyclobacteriaceae bacterium]MCH8515926.1 hypothetical protein [Cyclobacteriaceae bacterium]
MHLEPLSESEMKLLTTEAWILDRINLKSKINHFLAHIANQYQDHFRDNCHYDELKSWATSGAPKQSRGEFHEQKYPWNVLDYPATFNKNGILAFRTTLIWGKSISLSLLISGDFAWDEGVSQFFTHPQALLVGKEHFWTSDIDRIPLHPMTEASDHYRIIFHQKPTDFEEMQAFFLTSIKELSRSLEAYLKASRVMER